MAERRRKRLVELVDHWRPIAIALGALVLLNVLVNAFVIRPVVKSSGGREAILANELGALAVARKEVGELERTASKLACARSDVRHVFEDLLSSKVERMTAIQREVRDLARKNGLDPEQVSYNTAPFEDTGLVRFEIQFPLEGQYETLKTFIQQVEASKNFLIVEDVAMSEDREASTRLKLRVKLVTYFLAPDPKTLHEAFPTAPELPSAVEG